MRWWTLPIFVALAGSSYLECQQSSKISYDGQRVAAVTLVANPEISVDSLHPLVQQKPDEAYSTPKVEGTIAALKQTGRSVSDCGTTLQSGPFASISGET
jgi:hypothetical protein